MLGKRLREVRLANHQTQGDMAKLLNITRAAYSYYESGFRQPSMETVFSIAEHFHVSLDYLYERTDDPDFFPVLSDSEAILLERFRSSDERGRDTILNTAYHEYTRKKRLENAQAALDAAREAKKTARKNPFLNN